MGEKNQFLGAILLCFALVACGGGAGTSDQKNKFSGHFNAPPEMNRDELVVVAGKARVDCADPEDPASCHPGVGMMIMLIDGSLELCTTFAVGDDILATNSHCIPADLKAGGASCGDRIWVAFPKAQSFPEAKADCMEVLQASELKDGQVKIDYAYIRTAAPHGRPPIKINPDGFEDRGQYTVKRVNPIQNGEYPAGRLDAVSCHAFHTRELGGAESAESPIAALVNCGAVPGNSGSPILDSEGQVRGILQGSYTRSKSAEKSDQLTVVSSFSCIEEPWETLGFRAQASECSNI